MVRHATPQADQLRDAPHGPAIGPIASRPGSPPKPRDQARLLGPGELGRTARRPAGPKPGEPLGPIDPIPSEDGTHGRPDGLGHGRQRLARHAQSDGLSASLLQVPGGSGRSHAHKYTGEESCVTSVAGIACAS